MPDDLRLRLVRAAADCDKVCAAALNIASGEV